MKFRKDERVKIAAHTDAFMMGEKFATVITSGRVWNHVRGERSGRRFRFHVNGDGLEPTEPRVTLAKHGDLFCIRESSGGFSCLGFDVCERRTAGYLDWLAAEITSDSIAERAADIRRNPAARGTLERYAQYEAAVSLVREHNERTGRRCTSDLIPELIGLEGKRVEVVTSWGETQRFTVGKSSGFIPIHLELSSANSSGGGAAVGSPYKSVRVIS